jgi:hypothetical protein
MQRFVETDCSGERGAHLSDCGIYRYRLWRMWDATRPTLAFLMLNPSTADHHLDDPTLLRCRSRAIACGFGRVEIVNLFPLRAKDPAQLRLHPDPLGPVVAANGAIVDAMASAAMVICAWGAHPAAAARSAEVLAIIARHGWQTRLFHLGRNRDGSPRHPLYVAASTRAQRFQRAG